MDRVRSKVVAQTHTLSKALLFSYQVHMDTLCHTRIAILGFMTLLLSSDSALKRVLRVYKSTSKDQGSLSWSFSTRSCFPFPFSLPSLFGLFLWSLPFLHLYFNSTLVSIWWKYYQAFSHGEDPLSSHIVSTTQVTCCTVTIPVQVGRTLSEALH
jgi:hypothetical protein